MTCLLDAVRRAIPADVIEIAKVLERAGHHAWVVGGSLRDQLRTAIDGTDYIHDTDWDLATDAHPKVVQRLFRRVIPTGIKHGTVTVLFDKRAYELTTLRGEAGYSDGRRPDNIYFVDEIRLDLARRDFTVNAIAYEPLVQRIEDPFDGIGDLRRQLIRAVGDPLERFGEDGLRVLRAARFVASLEFELDPATASAIRPSLDSFKKVSPERVRDEWVKAMKSRKPSRAFTTMRDHGLLEITAPELQPAAGDNGPLELALRVVDLCPDSINVRFAALLHNLGSSCVAPILGLAPSVEAARAAELSYKLLQGLKFSNKDRDRIVALVRHQAILCPADLTDAELRRWLQQVTPVLVSDIEMLMTAIARAHVERTDLLEQVATLHARVRSILKQAPALKVSDLEVTGNDLVRECRVLPGPNVGRLLAALLELVIEQPDNNRRDFLVAAAKRWLSKNS